MIHSVVLYIPDASLRSQLYKSCVSKLPHMHFVSLDSPEGLHNALQAHKPALAITTCLDVFSKREPPSQTKVMFVQVQDTNTYPWFDASEHQIHHFMAVSQDKEFLSAELVRTLKYLSFLPKGNSIQGYLSCGGDVQKSVYRHCWLRGSRDIWRISEDIGGSAKSLGVRSFHQQRIFCVVSELFTNAVYDAPFSVNQNAYPRIHKSLPLSLRPQHWSRCEWGGDEEVFVVGLRDPFGSLSYETIQHHIGKLARRHESWKIMEYKKHGGTGLGFLKCFLSTDALIVRVKKGCFTHLTALIYYQRPSSLEAKSFHYYSIEE